MAVGHVLVRLGLWFCGGSTTLDKYESVQYWADLARYYIAQESRQRQIAHRWKHEHGAVNRQLIKKWYQRKPTADAVRHGGRHFSVTVR